MKCEDCGKRATHKCSKCGTYHCGGCADIMERACYYCAPPLEKIIKNKKEKGRKK